MSEPGQPFRYMLSAVLVGGGLLHMWYHSEWGRHDLTTIFVLILGAGIGFTPEVVALIKAWRGKDDD